MRPSRKYKSKCTHVVSRKIDLLTSESYNQYEEDYYSSSAYSDTALLFKPQDLKQKLLIAHNITQHCKEMKMIAKVRSGKAQDLKPILKRLNEYTCLPESELEPIFDSVIQRDRSFITAMKDIRVIPETTAALLADDIRSTFIKYVIEQKKFLSKMELLEDLKVPSSKYTKETFPLPRLVRNKLLKYIYYPEFSKYLLTEHPEKVYDRNLYLQRMNQLRLRQVNFVYVEVRRITPKGNAPGFIVGLAAVPSSGKTESFLTTDSTGPVAKKWLQQLLQSIVPKSSVIVLAQPKRRSKLTPHSKQSNLIAWLDQKGIPYHESETSTELYNLYTNFKGMSDKEGVYDHVFLNRGLTLVHFPSEWRSLNFFNSVWKDLPVMDAYHRGGADSLKEKILSASTLLKPIETEEHLIEEELKMIKEDRALEDFMENVFEKIKKGEFQSHNFPQECAGDETDYFEMHLSDFLLDIACE